jgi:tRNA (guanine37-N1)-methyltransferase
MLSVAVVTLLPEMFRAVTDYGVTGRAVERGLVDLRLINPRDFTSDRHHRVDDRPYGGGPGMVMMVEPLRAAIYAARGLLEPGAKTVYLSPQGKRLDQDGMKSFAKRDSFVLICGRYEGLDERLIASEVDEEWSVGDYVLSGGELAAMVLVDGVARLLPGALGHEASAQEDSFMEGLLDCAHYTRPEKIDGLSVPDVLLSGNHEAIRRWRLKQSLGRTWLRRPDLLVAGALSAEQVKLLREFQDEQQSELE